jgi:hypothetical protein
MATRKRAIRSAEGAEGEICPTCGRRTGDGMAAMLESLLERVGESLATDKVKATVADYLRLLQFREEMKGDERPKEIRVTWVEPGGKSESEG